jgi:hypothetical protein
LKLLAKKQCPKPIRAWSAGFKRSKNGDIERALKISHLFPRVTPFLLRESCSKRETGGKNYSYA